MALGIEGNDAVAKIDAEVQQIVKVQRRIRGIVACVDTGAFTIVSEKYGTFSFDPRSVKKNKNHPDRKPQVNDPCEFRLSHLNPPTAVSIRVAVPKEKRVTQPIDANDASIQRIYTHLEAHCAQHSALIGNIVSEELRLSLAVLTLFCHCLDLVEGTKALPASVKQMLLRDIPSFLNNPTLPTEMTSEHAAFFEAFSVISEVFAQFVPDRQRNIILSILRSRGDGMASFQGREIMTLEDHRDYRMSVGGLVFDGFGKLVDVWMGGRFNPLRASNSGKNVGAFVEKVSAICSFIEYEMDTPTNPDTAFGAAVSLPYVSGQTESFNYGIAGRSRSGRFPKNLWGHQFDAFGLMMDTRGARTAVHSLNVLLEDALGHVADLLEFLSLMVDHPDVFSLFAVPSLNACAYLVQLYGNSEVFAYPTSLNAAQVANQTVQDILAVEHPREAISWFSFFLEECKGKVEESDTLTSQLSATMDGVLSALHRMCTAIESHAPQEGAQASRTKVPAYALFAEKDAASGGQLFDLLGKVFTGDDDKAAPRETRRIPDPAPSSSGATTIADHLNSRGRIPLPVVSEPPSLFDIGSVGTRSAVGTAPTLRGQYRNNLPDDWRGLPSS